LPWNSGNDLAHTHDPKAPPNAPQAGHDDRIDKLLDDAEDALRKGDLARCTADTAAARFQGGGDRARLDAVTEKCLRALDNVPVVRRRALRARRLGLAGVDRGLGHRSRRSGGRIPICVL